MKNILPLFLLSFSSCYVSQVGINVESDNSSDLKCVLYVPSDDITGIDAKIYSIQKKAKAEKIVFHIAKGTEKYTEKDKEKTRSRYDIQSKLNTPVKAEDLSAIIMDVMKASPDDFWYKMYPIEENEQEKRWKIALAMKGQMKSKGVGQDFNLSVTMPADVTEISPAKNAAGVSAKKNGNKAVFSYAQMKGSEVYKFEVTAAKKKYAPPPPTIQSKEVAADPVTKNPGTEISSAPAIKSPSESNTGAQQVSSTNPTSADTQAEIEKEEDKPFWSNMSIGDVAGLLTAIAALIAAVATFRKKN